MRMSKLLFFILICLICTSFIFNDAIGCSSIANSNATISNAGNNSNAQTTGDVTITFPEQKDLTTNRSLGSGYRDFAAPGSVTYPGTPSYFGNATPGSTFQSVEVIVSYKDSFSIDELKMMARHAFGVKVMTNPLVPRVDEDKEAKDIVVFLGKPSHRAKAVAFITVRATREITSAELLAKALLEARKYGADAVQVTAEGVERQIESFGWGIGFAYSYASINVNEDRSGIGTGGTGIAGGHAGYKDKPWLRVIAIKFVP